MDLILFENYLKKYSVSTLVISAICLIVAIVVKRVFKNKIPSFIGNVLPLILGIILDIVYTCIINGKFTILGESFGNGLISGSLAIAIEAMIKGKKNKSLELSTILSLIDGVIEESNMENVAKEILTVLQSEKEEDEKCQTITDILNGDTIDICEAKMLAVFICESVKALTK